MFLFPHPLFASPQVLEDPSVRKAVRQEIELLSALSHPNVMQLLQVGQLSGGDKPRKTCEEDTQDSASTPAAARTVLHLVLEYAGHGSLWQWVQHHGALKEKRSKRVVGQIAGALAHCHENGIFL